MSLTEKYNPFTTHFTLTNINRKQSTIPIHLFRPSEKETFQSLSKFDPPPATNPFAPNLLDLKLLQLNHLPPRPVHTKQPKKKLSKYLKQTSSSPTSIKMRFSSASALISAASLLLAPTSAWIVGIKAPATITTDTEFTVTLITADYIQRVYDAAASFGLLPTGDQTPSEIDGLGTPFATSVLGESKSNILTLLDG